MACGGKVMYELRVKEHFDAAHKLVGYQGKCSQLHGHRWEVEVVITGHVLDRLNMLVDFSIVKGFMKGVLDTMFDHNYLNETLKTDLPTAEFIAKRLYGILEENVSINLKWSKLDSVTIWESPECSITYKGE